MSKILSFLFSLAAAATFVSCQKGDTGPAGANGATGPIGPAGPSYTGAVAGHVSLYDQYGSRILTGLNSVQLSINGNVSVTPDATGYYILNNISTGVYNIVATNNGFGATKINNFQFLKDTLNRDVKLSAIPNFSPISISSYPNSIGDSLSIAFNTDPRVRSFIIFLNTSSPAGSTPDKYLLVYTRNINANLTRPVGVVIPAQDLANAGIASGATVYVSVYGYVVNDGSAYEDLSTGKTVYNAVSTTSVTTSFVAP